MIEVLENRRLCSFSLFPQSSLIGPVHHNVHAPLSVTANAVSGYYDGINVNTSQDASKVIPILKEMNIKGVRIYLGMKTWNHRGNGQDFLQAKKYRNAGIRVMMQVGTEDVPTETQARGLFRWMKTKEGFSSVNMFQIGNEPNHYKSFHGSLNDYMRVLKTAWQELHPTGAKIVGAGPTYDVQACRELKALGYLKYVDYAAFHPYGNSTAQIVDRLKGAREVFSSKPLMVTEWNVRGKSNYTEWANEIKKARREINKYCDAAFYFCLQKANTMAGPAGIMTTSWKPNYPFYQAVKSFQTFK